MVCAQLNIRAYAVLQLAVCFVCWFMLCISLNFHSIVESNVPNMAVPVCVLCNRVMFGLLSFIPHLRTTTTTTATIHIERTKNRKLMNPFGTLTTHRYASTMQPYPIY